MNYYHVSLIQWDGLYPSCIFKSKNNIINEFVIVNYNGHNAMARINSKVKRPSFECKSIVREINIDE